MGAYRDIELEFIDRTMALIAQYKEHLEDYPFEQQYNYTLLINCLLGLFVLPKEKSWDQLSEKVQLDDAVKKEMGLAETTINPALKTLKQLLSQMRHSVAHFHISVESMDEQHHIDHIIFKDPKKGKGYVVATFVARELLPFLHYYTKWLKDSIMHSREAKKVKASKKVIY